MGMLDNRIAIVFGGTGKLGGVIAKRLHQEGSKVAVHYFHNRSRAEELVRKMDYSQESAFSIYADGTDEESLECAVTKVIEKFNRIDIVINAVHLPFEVKNIADSGINDWDLHLDALKTHYLICKSVLPVMRKQNYGRIIFISAALAVRYGTGCSMYTTIKSGLNGFTRTLAIEEAKNNILVNIVSPGGISDAVKQSGEDWDEMANEFIAHCPLGRLATSMEVANTVLYFASPLSDGITGQTLYVCGGEIML
jgi:3-oxoacyl-[acyl-carrier protein] reductase